jgi:catechol 2,3-dioxygenase-like lactoylglutathione lyase family enzyme
MFKVTTLDHVGIRVTDREAAILFYRQFGFYVDPSEEAPEYAATGLVSDHGVRIHLIYNSPYRHDDGNILMDIPVKWPGYTHAAFIVDDMDSLVKWLRETGIRITEGPIVLGHGRRKTCFVRDPDMNVVEFNEILE